MFAARPVGGELRLHQGETVEIGYFPETELPENLLWWHHQRILDALNQVIGKVGRQDATWPLSGQTRAEVYQLRDEGLLMTKKAMAHLCGRRRPDMEVTEVRPA